MVIRLLLCLTCVLAACRFGEGGFPDKACMSDQQCKPEEECTQGFCAQRACTVAEDCGTDHDFDCVDGACVVHTCGSLQDCELGYDCVSGSCVAGCVDHDGDGFNFGATCVDMIDCDDADATSSPAMIEGPRGSIFSGPGPTGQVATPLGTGLGLYLSRKLVQAHGGTLEVVSSEGEGSTFTMKVPVGG